MAFTKCDWSEGVWEGATAGCSVFVGLFGTVAEEIGKEKAFALLKKLGEDMGKGAGQMFKEQLGDEKIDIKKLAQFIIGFNGPFGCQMEIEEEPTHFRLRHYNCPVAQAFKNMATDYETGKRICYDWGVTLFENLLIVLAPEAKYEVAHYRENWDDYCEEKYTLETQTSLRYIITGKAREHYEKFLDLWSAFRRAMQEKADPEIAEMEDARKRLAGLKSQ